MGGTHIYLVHRPDDYEEAFKTDEEKEKEELGWGLSVFLVGFVVSFLAVVFFGFMYILDAAI